MSKDNSHNRGHRPTGRPNSQLPTVPDTFCNMLRPSYHAGDIQAVLNSHTAGVSDIHAWGLMLPSSSRVSPVTYHSVVAVRYPDLCRLINDIWELGSFASEGLPDRPPGFQFVLWDTNAKINGLVATDLETLVSQVLSLFPMNAGFADGLFVMTTATDHKNNLNRSVLKKDNARTLRVETIANSAGGTAQVAIVAQPSIGILNAKYYSNGSLRKIRKTVLAASLSDSPAPNS